nr:MAG TPA: Repressor protein CI [Caudoviricetes sp.]
MKGGIYLYTKFEELLQKNNKTAYRVAKDTGISSVTFTDWKKGRSKPKVDKLQKIADYFGVTIEYFLEEGARENG